MREEIRIKRQAEKVKIQEAKDLQKQIDKANKLKKRFNEMDIINAKLKTKTMKFKDICRKIEIDTSNFSAIRKGLRDMPKGKLELFLKIIK